MFKMLLEKYTAVPFIIRVREPKKKVCNSSCSMPASLSMSYSWLVILDFPVNNILL